MRVAIDARLLAYQSAGTSTYIRGIIGGLRQVEPDLQLLAIASRKGGALSQLSDVPHRFACTPCHHPRERWALGLELAALPVDVLHSPDFIPPRRLGRRWARVITVHDLAFIRFPELLTHESRRYYGQIFQATAEAERIIAVSGSTRDDLLELVSSSLAAKIDVIPEGIGPSFSPGDRAIAAESVLGRFGIDCPYFLFVGTIEPRKNLPRLIRAFLSFRARCGDPKVRLVIAGARGWLTDETDKELERAGDAVRYVGRVDTTDLLSLYRSAYALTLVSLYEGFGLPILEAMACGTPTIVSRAGSLPELAGVAGVVVSPDDENDIASAIERLWTDRALRDELVIRGLSRAARYSWPIVAEQTAFVYRQAAACAS